MSSRTATRVPYTSLFRAGAGLARPQGAWAQEGAPYLAPERLDLIAAYADSVIPATDTPGAIDAGVPRAIDAMLRDWASEKTRGDFVATLDAPDAAARSATGQGLAELLPDRRRPVVAALDRSKERLVGEQVVRPG